MSSTKAFDLPEAPVWKAYLDVKRSVGGPRVDGQRVRDFEGDLKTQL